MSFGICPNCINNLTEDSALMTKPSSIFKGDNVYLMCKNCQQVLLYNKNRNMLFDLDEYKEDEEVIKEINMLLSDIDNRYEVTTTAPPCSGNCSGCNGCDTQYQRSSNKRQVPVSQQEPEQEAEEPPVEDIINATLSNSFLAVNKHDPSQKKILTEDDFGLLKVDEWLFFELRAVEVKPIISYEVIRH